MLFIGAFLWVTHDDYVWMLRSDTYLRASLIRVFCPTPQPISTRAPGRSHSATKKLHGLCLLTAPRKGATIATVSLCSLRQRNQYKNRCRKYRRSRPRARRWCKSGKHLRSGVRVKSICRMQGTSPERSKFPGPMIYVEWIIIFFWTRVKSDSDDDISYKFTSRDPSNPPSNPPFTVFQFQSSSFYLTDFSLQ